MSTTPRLLSARVIGALRADPWLAVAFAITLPALVAPLWASSYLPFMDMPQHLATMRVLHSIDDAGGGLAGFYSVDLGSTQYLAYYYAVNWLAHLMPLEVANRVVLSLYAVALPVSMAAYLRAFGRDAAVALLAGPLVYNTFLFMGFANYLLALPLVLWGLAVLRRLMDDFSRARFALLTGIVLALFYSHAHAFLIYCVGAGFIGLLAGRGFHPRHWWRQALHLAPALALMAVWAARSAILAGDEAWGQGHGGRNVSPTDVRFEPMLDRLSAIPEQLMSAYPDDGDEVVLFAWLALAVLVALFRDGSPSQEDTDELGGSRAKLRARTPEVITTFLVAAYLLSPIAYKWIWPISHRMVPAVALFALAGLTWRRLPWRPALLVVPATLLNLYACQVHVDHAQRFDEEAGDVRALLDQAEDGKRIHGLIYERGSRVVNHAPYLHFAQYYVLDHGGVATFSFVDFPQSPIRYDPDAGPPRLPNRFEWTPEKFRWDRHGRYYDYFLLRGRARRAPFKHFEDKVELVETQGRWTLYRRAQP